MFGSDTLELLGATNMSNRTVAGDTQRVRALVTRAELRFKTEVSELQQRSQRYKQFVGCLSLPQIDDRLVGDDPFEGVDTESEFRFKPKTDFDDVKTKKVEFALPIALDRPNTLRINNRQGLFRFQLRINQLPLYFSIVGNGKAQFKSFISFTSIIPDSDSFDVTFDGGLMALRWDTLKNCLEEMLRDKDKTKQEAMEKIIRGEHLGKTETSRMGRRTVPAAQPTVPPQRSPDETVLSNDDLKGSNIFVTLPKDKMGSKKQKLPSLDQPLLQKVLQDDKGLADVVIPLTIRIYSTAKVIVLTVSGNKQNTKKIEKIKPEELFSAQRAEEINKAIVKTTLEIRKIESLRLTRQGPFSVSATNFAQVNKREVELVEGPDGRPVPLLRKQPSERIRLNKRIAKDFMNFRLTQFSLLTHRNASDVPLHLEKAEIQRKQKKEVLQKKLDAADNRREEERKRRIEREYLSRIVPLKANWIVLARFATVLSVLKKRFEERKEQKRRAEEATRKAVLIQTNLRAWFSKSKPPRTSLWRVVDAKLHLAAHMAFLEANTKKRATKVAAVFLQKCLGPIKLRHSCLQFVLYGN